MAEHVRREHHPRENNDAESSILVAHISWTATRCNRLLRPISSKIAGLRKVKQDGLNNGNATALEPCLQRSNISRCSNAREEGFHASSPSLDAQDTYWDASPRPQKKIKRTYSSKTKPQIPTQDLGMRNSIQDDACNIGKPQMQSHFLVPWGGIDVHMTRPDWKSWESHECSKNERIASTNRQNVSGRPSLKNSRTTEDSSRRVFQQLARREHGDDWKLYDGLYVSFEALLKATQCNTEAKKEGCRSLFSTCVRNVPQYISEEEYWSKLDDGSDSDVDISTRIYAELENSAIVDGWKPLREVVRAHGLNMMGSVIKDSLVGLDMADELVSLCVNRGAHGEAQTLMESMMATLKPLESCVANTPLMGNQALIIRTIQQYSLKTEQYGFLFRKLATLAEGNVLSLPGLSASSLKDCWNRMIQSITCEDSHYLEACALFRVMVKKAYQPAGFELPGFIHQARRSAAWAARARQGLRSVKSSQSMESRGDGSTTTSARNGDDASGSKIRYFKTVAELLTVLLAVNILRGCGSSDDHDVRERVWTVLQDMAIETLQALELSSLNVGPGQAFALNLSQVILPLMTFAITSSRNDHACADTPAMERSALNTLACLPVANKGNNHVALFLCGVARCCGEATSSDTFDFARHIVQRLMDLSSSSANTKMAKSLCSSIAETTAFAFSQDTSQPTHLEWALGVEHASKSSHEASPRLISEKTPARVSQGASQGYRWEDGICEWIAKTPGMLIAKKTNVDTGDEIKNKHPTQLAVTGIEQLPSHRFEVSPCSKAKKRKASETLAKDSGHVSVSCVRNIIPKATNFGRLCHEGNLFKAEDRDVDELSSSTSSQGVSGHRFVHRCQDATQKKILPFLSCHRLKNDFRASKVRHNEIGKKNWDTEDELGFG